MSELEEKRRVDGTYSQNETWDLSLLLDNINVGFFSRDIKRNKYLNISHACLEIYGYTLEEFRTTNNLYYELAVPEDRWILDRQLADLQLGKKTCEEYRIRHKDGSIRWIEVRSIPVIDNAVLVQVDGAVSDITARKISELKLSNANAFIESVIDALPGVFYVFDSDGNYKYWNKELETITGYSSDEMRRLHPSDLFEEHDKKNIAEAVQYVMAYGHANTEAPLLSKDGTKTPFYFSGRRILIDGEAHLVGMGIDITEKRKAEDAVQKSQEMLMHILHSIPQAIAWKDVDGIFLGCNSVYAKCVGFDNIDQIIGRSDLDLPGLLEDAKRFRADDQQVLLSEVPKVHVLESLQHENDNKIWLDSTKIPLRGKDNRIYGILGIFEDITQRIQEEERLQKTNQDLIQKNIGLRQFSYIVSHNLRSPITKLLGLTSLLDGDAIDPALSQELITYIKSEVSGLDHIVTDLNTIVGAQEMGVMPLEEVVIEEELKRVLQSLDSDIVHSEALLRANLKAVPVLKTVRAYLHSILYNLISNAIKYRNPERTLIIAITARPVCGFIRITVEDNGLGIDLAKHREKVFGLYNRFHPGSIPGRGIGLNLVKTQAETLGGRVELESTPKVGSKFKIYLPDTP